MDFDNHVTEGDTSLPKFEWPGGPFKFRLAFVCSSNNRKRALRFSVGRWPRRKALVLKWGVVFLTLLTGCSPQLSVTKNDRKKDVEIVTTKGPLVIRLSDSTPLHRDNFLKLVKQHYYDSILFHRVINQFMIQAGDPDSKRAQPGQRLGNGGPGYTIPAEIRPGLFHKKGVIAAARMGDQVNPTRASSGSQFYLVQGKVFTEAGLDSLEQFSLRGYKIPAAHRQVYTTLGGTPHLDNNYTVFGEVVRGLAVIDSIAAVPTSGSQGGDRPLQDVQIIKARLVKRK